MLRWHKPTNRGLKKSGRRQAVNTILCIWKCHHRAGVGAVNIKGCREGKHEEIEGKDRVGKKSLCSGKEIF